MRPNRLKQPSLARTFARLAPATLLVQILSFGSSIVLATRLGASTKTDAYYLALSVPVVAYAVLLAGIRLGGIPKLTAVAAGSSEDELSGACSQVVTGTLVASAVLSVLVTAVMVILLPAAAGGSSQFASLTRYFMIELIPYAVTGALLGVFGAILAVKGRFTVTAMVLTFEPVLKSILLLAFTKQLGIQALLIGNLLGNALAVVVLWRLVERAGVVIRLTRFYRSPVVRSIFKLSAPLVVSQSLLQLNPLIDRTTAAGLGHGSVTEFELGVRLFTAPASLLAATLVAPLAANWSARYVKEGWSAVTRSFGRVIAAVVIAVPPVIVLGFILRHELVAVAYSSHAYTPSAVNHTANVLGMLLLGLLAAVTVVPVSTLFIVRGDTMFPLKIGIANCVINAILDLLLRGPLGVTGIALSTALTLTTLCGVYVMTAHRRWGPLNLGSVAGRPAMVSAVSCVAIAGLSLFGAHLAAGDGSRWAQLAILLAVGLAAMGIHVTSVLLGRAWPAVRAAAAPPGKAVSWVN